MSTNVPRDQKMAYIKLKLDHELEIYKAQTERQKVHVDGYNAKTLRWRVVLHLMLIVALVYCGPHLAAPAKEIFNYIVSSILLVDKPGKRKSERPAEGRSNQLFSSVRATQKTINRIHQIGFHYAIPVQRIVR